MSWSLTLHCDRPIEERDIVRVLFNRDVSKFPERQLWGWSSLSTGLGVDVALPEGSALRLRGAGYSAHLAEDAAKTVAAGLRRLGYKVRTGRLSG